MKATSQKHASGRDACHPTKGRTKDGLLLVLALLICLAALVAGAAAQTAAAAVTLDGAVHTGVGAANTSTVAISHTTGTGVNRLMLVGVSWNCGTTNRTISSVTFTPSGGSATNLTEVITQLGYNSTNPRYSAIYKLLSPPSGVSGTVTRHLQWRRHLRYRSRGRELRRRRPDDPAGDAERRRGGRHQELAGDRDPHRPLGQRAGVRQRVLRRQQRVADGDPGLQPKPAVEHHLVQHAGLSEHQAGHGHARSR